MNNAQPNKANPTSPLKPGSDGKTVEPKLNEDQAGQKPAGAPSRTEGTTPDVKLDKQV